jgi:hypothetical protein
MKAGTIAKRRNASKSRVVREPGGANEGDVVAAIVGVTIRQAKGMRGQAIIDNCLQFIAPVCFTRT